MRRLRISRVVAAVVAVVTGGALAAFGPAGPAVAYFSPPLYLDLRVDTPAYLVAGGAAVNVPVEVICTSSTAYVTVTITQSVNGTVAQGSTWADVGCTHAWQTFLLTVPATVSGAAFVRGSALAQASTSACTGPPDYTCGAERYTATIRLRR